MVGGGMCRGRNDRLWRVGCILHRLRFASHQRGNTSPPRVRPGYAFKAIKVFWEENKKSTNKLSVEKCVAARQETIGELLRKRFKLDHVFRAWHSSKDVRTTTQYFTTTKQTDSIELFDAMVSRFKLRNYQKKYHNGNVLKTKRGVKY